MYLIFVSTLLMIMNSKNMLILVLGVESMSLFILFYFSFFYSFFFFLLLILVVCGGLSLVVITLLNLTFYYKSNVSFMLK